jgi:hypothetical protein
MVERAFLDKPVVRQTGAEEFIEQAAFGHAGLPHQRDHLPVTRTSLCHGLAQGL